MTQTALSYLEYAVWQAFPSLGKFKQLCKGSLCAAVQAAYQMEQQGTQIPIHILYLLLQECIKKKDMAMGIEIFRLVKRSGLESNALLGSSLIRMFALCGGLFEAKQVLNLVPEPNAFAWSAIITAHTKLGQAENAIELYDQMQKSNVKPDAYVFVAILKACGSAKALSQGKLIHAHMIEREYNVDIFVDNALVDMYAKCGSLEDAHKLFYDLPRRNVVTWTAMITACVQHGHGLDALQLFQQMLEEDIHPDLVTYVSILKACSSLTALDQGKLIHSYAIESGFEFYITIGSTLIDMYGKCGALDESCKVFCKLPYRNLVTWSAMIAAYGHNGQGHQALQAFQHMQLEGIEPDGITFVSIVNACSSLAGLDWGMLIHTCILQRGFKSNLFIGNALIDMYAKGGLLENACRVFRELPSRDVITWNTMMAGFIQHGHGHEALRLFSQMQREQVEPTIVTLVNALKACSGIAALDQAKLIHDHIMLGGFESEVFMGNTLIDMYMKCWSLQDACSVFDKMPTRDVATWSAMIGGYAQHNDFQLALHFFKEMKREGLKPNDVTFTCLLSACSHMGLVDEGFDLFYSMKVQHGTRPTPDHYNCMVDLLGRAGCLLEAYNLLVSAPSQSNALGWMCLLSHCRTHGNFALGRQCFENVIPLDCSDASGYVLLSNIFADSCMWEAVNEVKEMKESKHVQNKPGKAFIELKKRLHIFVVGDKSHPQSDDIYVKLKRVSLQMMDGGYVPLNHNQENKDIV